MEPQMSKIPPVPEQNRSPKGSTDAHPDHARDKPSETNRHRDDESEPPDEKGRQANLKQNIHHPGSRQDR